MNWQILTSIEQIKDIAENISKQKPCIIFKHSTTCSISAIANHRIKDLAEAKKDKFEIYHLDLIANREVSNYIAERFSVHHESPQVLLIKDGECSYEESHLGISVTEIIEQIDLLHA